MFFIDESGSISKNIDFRYKNRFFVVAFIHTDNPRRVKNIYKRAMQKLRKKYPDFFSNIENPNECKGSEMLPFMKYYIFEKLITLTDIKFSYMVVDVPNMKESFRMNPGRSFNYIIKLLIENYPLSEEDKKKLDLVVDNRNVALEGIRELEGYLFQTLILEQDLVSDVKVQYVDSSTNFNVQISDLISNSVYQYYRYNTMPFPNFNDLTQDNNYNYNETYKYIHDLICSRSELIYKQPIGELFGSQQKIEVVLTK